MGMYAKLMSRITESSLMDEDVIVRYTFMMLLAIADPYGYVVGTDVAIARRLNVSLADFQKCVAALMEPDPNSNSQEHEGRRVIESDCERGYFLVNYRKYRDTRDEEQRRNYMREYMRKRRGANDVADVNSCKLSKPPLAKAEAEAKGEGKADPPNPQRGNGQAKAGTPVSVNARRLAAIFHRSPTTQWTANEVRAFKRLTISEEDLNSLELYYSSSWPPCRDKNILRHDLSTLLNNFAGEVDRAKMWAAKQSNGFKKSESAAKREDRFEDPMAALVRKTLEEAK